jgi:hypothetical protein
VSACCGPLQKDLSDLKLPDVRKDLDRVHAEIAARHDGKLYAGAAMVDITTEWGRRNELYLGGFDAGRMNVAVRDPVYAHALYLDDGREVLVIVTLDVIGLMNDDVNDIRAIASDLHRDRIVVASVHDHVGPDTVGYWGPAAFGVLPLCPGTVPGYMATMKRLVGQAIDQAAASARPARLRFGTAMADPTLSINMHPEIWKHPGVLEPQKDDLVRALFAEDASDGKPIATLANWGCHAEAMWNDDQLSADWPGVFYKRWAAEVGGVPLFAEGALGGLVDIDPGPEKMASAPAIMDVFLAHMSTDERLALRDRMGNGFFDAVLAAHRGATETVGPEGVTLSVARRVFKLEQDNWIFEYMGKRKIIRRSWEHKGGKTFLFTDILAARLRAGGRVVADLATVPGEPAPTVVVDLDATSPAAFKFTIALGNDETGYMVREADWNHPAYEYERTMSLGPATATTVVDVVRSLRGAL